MTEPIDWTLVRTFLAVLTTGSLSAAARQLGITQPTAGRHVAALEAALGQALFIRSQTGLQPTAAAQALREPAQLMQSTAATIARTASAFGLGVAGPVRISASEVIGVEVLPTLLAALRQTHPGLVIELVVSNRLQDLLHHEADIAVRMARPAQGLLVARRAGDIEIGLFARDDYLARHGRPLSVDDLAGHALIGFDRAPPWLRSLRPRQPAWKREAFALRTDNDNAQLALLRAGAGIAACQVPLAVRDPRLIRVLAGQVRLRLPAWVAMHRDQRAQPRVKAVFDALVDGLRAYAGARD